MPICKICGRRVTAGPVMHSDCLTKQVTEAVEEFYDRYCFFPRVYPSQEELHRERCDNCPMNQLMKLVK